MVLSKGNRVEIVFRINTSEPLKFQLLAAFGYIIISISPILFFYEKFHTDVSFYTNAIPRVSTMGKTGFSKGTENLIHIQKALRISVCY